jgi:hypothetical protein
MAKETKETKETNPAWEKFVAAYKEANPVKYAAKLAAGHFDKPSASFTGKNALNIKG